ncbi:type 4a pilus biogenesis protein PilO [Patescibacteria group bacterium]|nr:type 4a pilus biogenesis protein PilO [Patescibacteria group bacterium]MBU4458413.1 type 4a pilus biogenesis protein PilO [Patescibacteria group bacterium]MCG2695832.1 type 4a pilus biogenesis protein PilO [Candidatus Portnoybacteria bacterium]
MTKNIIIIVLILGFIGIVVLLDIPKVQGIFDLKNQIKEQRKVLEGKQYLISIVEKLRDTYENNKENLNKLEYIMPGEQEVPNLIVQLEVIAVKGGLILGEIGFKVEDKNAETNQDYKSLTVNINLVGDYAAFERFLSAVEENIRLMDVESINFIVQSETASLFNFNVVFKVYYQ